ncbi:MAG: hypothetical protein V4648_01660 [Bacteroidota bacterium]
MQLLAQKAVASNVLTGTSFGRSATTRATSFLYSGVSIAIWAKKNQH